MNSPEEAGNHERLQYSPGEQSGGEDYGERDDFDGESVLSGGGDEENESFVDENSFQHEASLGNEEQFMNEIDRASDDQLPPPSHHSMESDHSTRDRRTSDNFNDTLNSNFGDDRDQSFSRRDFAAVDTGCDRDEDNAHDSDSFSEKSQQDEEKYDGHAESLVHSDDEQELIERNPARSFDEDHIGSAQGTAQLLHFEPQQRFLPLTLDADNKAQDMLREPIGSGTPPRSQRSGSLGGPTRLVEPSRQYQQANQQIHQTDGDNNFQDLHKENGVYDAESPLNARRSFQNDRRDSFSSGHDPAFAPRSFPSQVKNQSPSIHEEAKIPYVGAKATFESTATPYFTTKSGVPASLIALILYANQRGVDCRKWLAPEADVENSADVLQIASGDYTVTRAQLERGLYGLGLGLGVGIGTAAQVEIKQAVSAESIQATMQAARGKDLVNGEPTLHVNTFLDLCTFPKPQLYNPKQEMRNRSIQANLPFPVESDKIPRNKTPPHHKSSKRSSGQPMEPRSSCTPIRSPKKKDESEDNDMQKTESELKRAFKKPENLGKINGFLHSGFQHGENKGFSHRQLEMILKSMGVNLTPEKVILLVRRICQLSSDESTPVLIPTGMLASYFSTLQPLKEPNGRKHRPSTPHMAWDDPAELEQGPDPHEDYNQAEFKKALGGRPFNLGQKWANTFIERFEILSSEVLHEEIKLRVRLVVSKAVKEHPNWLKHLKKTQGQKSTRAVKEAEIEKQIRLMHIDEQKSCKISKDLFFDYAAWANSQHQQGLQQWLQFEQWVERFQDHRRKLHHQEKVSKKLASKNISAPKVARNSALRIHHQDSLGNKKTKASAEDNTTLEMLEKIEDLHTQLSKYKDKHSPEIQKLEKLIQMVKLGQTPGNASKNDFNSLILTQLFSVVDDIKNRNSSSAGDQNRKMSSPLKNNQRATTPEKVRKEEKTMSTPDRAAEARRRKLADDKKHQEDVKKYKNFKMHLAAEKKRKEDKKQQHILEEERHRKKKFDDYQHRSRSHHKSETNRAASGGALRSHSAPPSQSRRMNK